MNLAHQVQYEYNVTALQKANSTSDTYRLTLAWNSLQTHVRTLRLCCLVLSLSHDRFVAGCLSSASSATGRPPDL